jgi:hypothetical protein
MFIVNQLLSYHLSYHSLGLIWPLISDKLSLVANIKQKKQILGDFIPWQKKL